jgi:hypothetical protein
MSTSLARVESDLILLCLCLWGRDTYYGDRDCPMFEEGNRTYNFFIPVRIISMPPCGTPHKCV